MLRLNLLSLTLFCHIALAATVNYSYDDAGRLTKADYGATGSINYTYDKSGNLLSRVVQNGASGTGGTITSINTAGAGPDIAQNDWIEIKGVGITPVNTPASGVIWNDAPEFGAGKLPTQLKGVSVTVNGKPAYVYFYCSGTVAGSICAKDQINVLTPLDSTEGNVQVVVTNGSTQSASFQVNKKTLVPSFLLFSPPEVVATHANNSLLGPATLYPGLSTPAKPGELVVLYAVGFGLPATTLTDGSSSQSGSLQPLPVCKVGGNPVSVAFAGLISPGLYQVNLTIPVGTSGSGQRHQLHSQRRDHAGRRSDRSWTVNTTKTVMSKSRGGRPGGKGSRDSAECGVDCRNWDRGSVNFGVRAEWNRRRFIGVRGKKNLIDLSVSSGIFPFRLSHVPHLQSRFLPTPPARM